MSGWVLAAVAAVLYLWSRGTGEGEGEAALTREQLIDVARQEARASGVPEWLVLANMDVESGIRHLGPRGSGMGRTYYPMGIQTNRGMDLTGLDGEDLHDSLSDAQANIHVGAQEWARIWGEYSPDVDRARMAWVMPAYARRGPPYPEKTGSVATATRLGNWRRAVARWGGPAAVA